MSKAIIALALVSLQITSAFRPMTVTTRRSQQCNRNSAISMMSDLILGANPTIEEWLDVAEPGLKKTTMGMFRAVKEIAYKIRTASCDKMSCFNDYGGEQLAIDIVANNIIYQNLKLVGSVATASSEETPTEDPMGGKGYSVAFDPLDGSSGLDANFAAGTIWGVWPGDKLNGMKGSHLKSAGIAVYGPRTTITLALSNLPGSHEFLLVDDYSAMHGQWVKSNEFSSIGEGKLLAPVNLRATQDNPGYAELFNYWMKENYQLRTTGGIVSDTNRLMVKGKGVFVNAASKAAASEVSLMYEAAPIGFLIEKAGGRSSDGEKSVLELTITSPEQVTQCAFGSAGEVKRFEDLVGRKYL